MLQNYSTLTTPWYNNILRLFIIIILFMLSQTMDYTILVLPVKNLTLKRHFVRYHVFLRQLIFVSFTTLFCIFLR